MSQWSHENPERMAEIAALPPSQQNAELRHAMTPALRNWCPDCERSFVDPYEEKMCPDCGARAGAFVHRDETETL